MENRIIRLSDKEHIVNCQYRNPSICKFCNEIYLYLVIKNKIYKNYDDILLDIGVDKLYHEDILKFDVFKNTFNFFILKNLRNNRRIFGNIRYSNLSDSDKDEFNQIVYICLYLIFNEYRCNNSEIKDYYENTPLLLLKYVEKEWLYIRKQLHNSVYKEILISDYLHRHNTLESDLFKDHRYEEKETLYKTSLYALNRKRQELENLTNNFKEYLNKEHFNLFYDYFICNKSKADIYKSNKIIKQKDAKIIDSKLSAIFDCIKFYYNKNNVHNKNKDRKYVGVYKVTVGSFSKYRSIIKIDRKHKHLGYYDNPEEAARAYDNAVRNSKNIIREGKRGLKPKYELNFPKNKTERQGMPVIVNKINIHEIIKFANVPKKERIEIFSKIQNKGNAKIEVYLDFFLNFNHGDKETINQRKKK